MTERGRVQRAFRGVEARASWSVGALLSVWVRAPASSCEEVGLYGIRIYEGV